MGERGGGLREGEGGGGGAGNGRCGATSVFGQSM